MAAGSKDPALVAYRAKRDFTKTPEPDDRKATGSGDSFVIQKHAARRLHYDFRLELDGVLKSWAVARGPSLIAGDKRLAVHTEDHPLAYGGFEGVIPKGQYGGGTVLLWDRGRWLPDGDPREAYARGRLTFRLEGEKLSGTWYLVRTHGGGERQEHWLLIKAKDEAARAATDPDILEEAPLSVASGRDLDAVAAARDRVWQSTPQQPEDLERLTRAAGRVAADARKAALPGFIEPMLASLRPAAPEGADWVHEIKHDGYRIQARIAGGEVRLLTRRGLDWSARFRSVARALEGLKVDAALIDGEVVVEGPSGASDFSLLQEALAAGRSQDMRFFVFDLLHLDGRDLRRLPLIQRKEALFALVDGVDESIRFSEHLETAGEAIKRHACRLGLEGVVSKRRDGRYTSGRSDGWVKSKCAQRDTFVIGGFTRNGKRLGSLAVGYHDNGGLSYAGRVGSGFTDALAADLEERLEPLVTTTAPFSEAKDRDVIWVKPELVADVEHRGWTRDRRLRQAVFKGVRDDRRPQDARPDQPPPATAGTEPDTPRLTNPGRILWPDSGLTKRDLADYLLDVAPRLLPHIAGRPLSLVRCPGGIGEPCFFQKHRMPGLPDSVRVLEVAGEDAPVLAVEDADGLAGLAQMGVVEIHPWGSRLDDLDHPDRLVFDLDPGDGVDWQMVCEAALDIRDRLADLGLTGFAKTTGGKGLHVVVPLVPDAPWEAAKDFAHRFARDLAADDRRFTAKLAKAARGGRIFIDYLRNGRGATAVAAFSPRARAGATVSTPLAWDEVATAIRSDQFTITTLHRRLSVIGDPWGGFDAVRQTVPGNSAPARRLKAQPQPAEADMPQQTPEQQKIVGRVMHEFKRGALESSAGGTVKNPKQAVAIALHEAGASREETPKKNRENLQRTRSRQRRGETAADGETREQLYAEARKRGISGRSRMTKAELKSALGV